MRPTVAQLRKQNLQLVIDQENLIRTFDQLFPFEMPDCDFFKAIINNYFERANQNNYSTYNQGYSHLIMIVGWRFIRYFGGRFILDENKKDISVALLIFPITINLSKKIFATKADYQNDFYYWQRSTLKILLKMRKSKKPFNWGSDFVDRHVELAGQPDSYFDCIEWQK